MLNYVPIFRFLIQPEKDEKYTDHDCHDTDHTTVVSSTTFLFKYHDRLFAINNYLLIFMSCFRNVAFIMCNGYNYLHYHGCPDTCIPPPWTGTMQEGTPYKQYIVMLYQKLSFDTCIFLTNDFTKFSAVE